MGETRRGKPAAQLAIGQVGADRTNSLAESNDHF